MHQCLSRTFPIQPSSEPGSAHMGTDLLGKNVLFCREPQGVFILYFFILGHDIFLYSLFGFLEIWHQLRNILWL